MHQLELRRTQGFAMGPYSACLRRIESLYNNLLDITGAGTEDEGNEGAIERRGRLLWGEADHGPALVLPAPLNTHLYMSLLSCRFDVDEPTTVVWNSGEMCRLVREMLQPVLLLSDAEHYACMPFCPEAIQVPQQVHPDWPLGAPQAQEKKSLCQ